VTSLSYSGSTLSVGLSDNQNVGLSLSSVSVLIGKSPCTSLTGTFSSFTCTLPLNSDTTPLLVAGTVTPLIAVAGYGIAPLSSGVNALSVPLVVSSILATSGGNNGGYQLTISGSGFPLQASQVSITVCSNSATIKSSTNKLITFYMPSCGVVGTYPVNVVVGSLSDSSLSFTYNDASGSAPTIFSLSPTSANPGAKGVL